MYDQLRPHLFPEDGTHTYAIIDGASCEELLPKLDELQPEYVCLYAGELAPDLEECAPYLVRLEPDSEFARWFIEEGWGKHWGIFATSPADLRAMRKHFRSFLLVKGPEGKTIYFRYYDPRVLAIYSQTMRPTDVRIVFDSISQYLCETEGRDLNIYRSIDSELKRESIVTSQPMPPA